MTALAGSSHNVLSSANTTQAGRVPASQRPTRFDVPASERPTTLELRPTAVPVAGVTRDIKVKIASERQEFEEAFQLVAANYRARGYEAASAKPLRFTPFHALPDTTTFVAKRAGQVVATLSLVVDNVLLGLPMECIYGQEIHALREEGRRLGEVTSLADTGLGVREFLQVFVSMIKLMVHYHTNHGGDTCVISVNPRHRNFYAKVIGFVPLGPCRSYPSVQDAPAEAYVVDFPLMRANAPTMYGQIVGKEPLASLLTPQPMPSHLVRYFGNNSTQASLHAVEDILNYVTTFGSPRRW